MGIVILLGAVALVLAGLVVWSRRRRPPVTLVWDVERGRWVEARRVRPWW